MSKSASTERINHRIEAVVARQRVTKDDQIDGLSVRVELEDCVEYGLMRGIGKHLPLADPLDHIADDLVVEDHGAEQGHLRLSALRQGPLAQNVGGRDRIARGGCHRLPSPEYQTFIILPYAGGAASDFSSRAGSVGAAEDPALASPSGLTALVESTQTLSVGFTSRWRLT